MTISPAAKYLHESRSWTYKVLEAYDKHGHVDFSEDRGPKRITTENEDLQMVNIATDQKTTEQIAETLSDKGTPVSRWTVARRLNEQKIHWMALLKKTLLSTQEFQIDIRLKWARENRNLD